MNIKSDSNKSGMGLKSSKIGENKRKQRDTWSAGRAKYRVGGQYFSDLPRLFFSF